MSRAPQAVSVRLLVASFLIKRNLRFRFDSQQVSDRTYEDKLLFYGCMKEQNITQRIKR